MVLYENTDGCKSLVGLFNFNCYCTCLIIPAVVTVGKYCVMANFSAAAVLRAKIILCDKTLEMFFYNLSIDK